MFWKLGVLDRMREKDMGVITIYYFTIDGQEVKNYEFIGAGSDGGTWEWQTGTEGIEAALTSNFTHEIATILQSPNWGSTPPVAQPWFDSATKDPLPGHWWFNRCVYLKMPQLSLEWRPTS
jgi:hypothetical protein